MKTKIYLIALVGLCYSWNVVMSQSFNLEPGASESTLIGLKVSLPVFEKSEWYNVKAMSGIYTLYSAVPFSKKWSLYAELPFIVSKYEDGNENETGLGNIFLAARVTLNEKRTSLLSLGAFLPTISEDKYSLSLIGWMSNYYRYAQVVSAYTIYGNYSYRTDPEKSWILGIEVGPEVVIPKAEVESDSEVWLHLSLQAGYRINKLALWAEFNDIIYASQLDQEIDFNDRNINQLVLCGQYEFGVIRPGISYMFPLKDDISDLQKGAIGVKVDFLF